MPRLFKEVKPIIYPLAKRKEKKEMIIDYNDKEQMEALGIRVNEECGRIFIGEVDEYNGATFRNFPTITTHITNFTNCVFENCQGIEFSESSVQGCTFRNVSSIEGHYTDFLNCEFAQCCSQGPFLTIDSDGEVRGCIFDNVIALSEGGDGYIIYSVYGKKKDVKMITGTQFKHCTIENDNSELTHCEYYVPLSYYKTKEICNLDEGEPIMKGSFETEFDDGDNE